MLGNNLAPNCAVKAHCDSTALVLPPSAVLPACAQTRGSSNVCELESAVAADPSDVPKVVWASFIELGGGKTYDLLSHWHGPKETTGQSPHNAHEHGHVLKSEKPECVLMDDAGGRTVVIGCNFVRVTNAAHLVAVIEHGKSRRATEATSANATSSRSHALIRIVVGPPLHTPHSLSALADSPPDALPLAAPRPSPPLGLQLHDASLLAGREGGNEGGGDSGRESGRGSLRTRSLSAGPRRPPNGGVMSNLTIRQDTHLAVNGGRARAASPRRVRRETVRELGSAKEGGAGHGDQAKGGRAGSTLRAGTHRAHSAQRARAASPRRSTPTSIAASTAAAAASVRVGIFRSAASGGGGGSGGTPRSTSRLRSAMRKSTDPRSDLTGVAPSRYLTMLPRLTDGQLLLVDCAGAFFFLLIDNAVDKKENIFNPAAPI
ncbi:hypothetical protein T492DRAFT_835125 [Pavlovales sp. CCMP2436]|nr:hypothetical protein T492DRAFT_835125 [Pavlovales sp. CCMP2436]